MTSWIFQGNPSIFDIDGYLHSTPGAITWLAKQNATEIAVGDTVYLWRSQGKASAERRSGVIASAEVIFPAAPMVDEPESTQKMVGAPARRRQVEYAKGRGLSERMAPR